MAIVVVGGHSRSVGKTSVVAGLIAALPDYDWTAVKITQFGHGFCSADGQPCECATADHSWAITQEQQPSDSDSGRFLAAGASRSLWVRTRVGELAAAMPELRRRLEGTKNVIMESNSVVKFLRPDLYLVVLDPATKDFKESAQRYLDRASAVLMHEGAEPQWEKVSLMPVRGKPRFLIRPPEYMPGALAEFVRAHL